MSLVRLDRVGLFPPPAAARVARAEPAPDTPAPDARGQEQTPRSGDRPCAA
jgi:hypothetical protein